ncbi:MAG: DUF5719 family protein [bacterium]|nr:DUF5719 family protein [bacterium]
MSRLMAILVAGMLLAAAVMVPGPPELDPATGSTGPVEEKEPGIGPSAHCPWALSDGSRRSSYIAVAASSTEAELSFVEGGRLEPPLSGQTATGPNGVVAKIDNPRQVGVSSAFVEFEGNAGAAGVVASGDDILAGYLCPARIPATWHLPGGSTLEGEGLVLRLFNPFTADARVDLWALSELGTEADDRLEGLTVPARQTRIVVIDEILDGRETLAIIVRPSAGSVIPVMSLDRDTDSAVWAGTAPSQGWEFPVASVEGLDSALVLTNEGSLEVNFLVEVFDEAGEPGTPLSGFIVGPGQARIALSELLPSGVGLRVTGDGPFGAALIGRSETAVAVAPGLPTNADTWLVPGPGAIGANARLSFLNTGVTDVTVTYTPLNSSGDGGSPESLVLPPASVTSVALSDPGTDAVVVSGDGQFSVGWWAEGGGKVALGGALPGG